MSEAAEREDAENEVDQNLPNDQIDRTKRKKKKTKPEQKRKGTKE
jgi:hypothetical protein